MTDESALKFLEHLRDSRLPGDAVEWTDEFLAVQSDRLARASVVIKVAVNQRLEQVAAWDAVDAFDWTTLIPLILAVFAAFGLDGGIIDAIKGILDLLLGLFS